MCSRGFNQNDLINMMSVLEVCTTRGAFKAEELTGVGQLYDKLKMCRESLVDNTTQVEDDDITVVDKEETIAEIVDLVDEEKQNI